MSNLTISFASLVKNNGGLFKSVKQAAFLTSQLVDNDHYAFHKAYNNTSATIYTCDTEGVSKVTKQNTVKGCKQWVTVWDRNDASFQAAVVDNVNVKRLRAFKASIKDCVESLDHYSNIKADQTTLGEQNIYNRRVAMHVSTLKAKIIGYNSLNGKVLPFDIKAALNTPTFTGVSNMDLYSVYQKAQSNSKAIVEGVINKAMKNKEDLSSDKNTAIFTKYSLLAKKIKVKLESLN